MRRAPTWVCNCARYILFGRLIRHKVQGRLLPPRAVHVGVDMGRSFSVFLFCLAMDPIYHYLNRIPRVMSVQGYIDVAASDMSFHFVMFVFLGFCVCVLVCFLFWLVLFLVFWVLPPFYVDFFFCSNALIALARSLCKCLLAVLITASGADAVTGYLVRCACIDNTIPYLTAVHLNLKRATSRPCCAFHLLNKAHNTYDTACIHPLINIYIYQLNDTYTYIYTSKNVNADMQSRNETQKQKRRLQLQKRNTAFLSHLLLDNGESEHPSFAIRSLSSRPEGEFLGRAGQTSGQ